MAYLSSGLGKETGSGVAAPRLAPLLPEGPWSSSFCELEDVEISGESQGDSVLGPAVSG